MEGIRYIIKDKGEKKSVVIDLDTYGHLWGDIHDILIVESRKSEPRKNWEDVKKVLHEKELYKKTNEVLILSATDMARKERRQYDKK